MASKKSLLGGMSLKVENMSGFDKSRYNAFTAPLGAIVPMCKQLLLPGKAKVNVKLSAQLPPLASDAFLRTHLKVEAFLIPLRLCYGGFQSWFAGEQISSAGYGNPSFHRAKLPRLMVYGGMTATQSGHEGGYDFLQSRANALFGPHSLFDYFNVKYPINNVSGNVYGPNWFNVLKQDEIVSGTAQPYYRPFNIFPFIAYQLCYHHWYRNKLIEKPLFCPPDFDAASIDAFDASVLPFVSYHNIHDVKYDLNLRHSKDYYLLNGYLTSLRHRNYGYDYFTTALPSPQDGNAMTVQVSSNKFTISALRLANSLQQFAENNQVAGPDYIQALRSRYNRAPSSSVAQKPVLLGSADFPMFTSGVEQSAPNAANSSSTQNPYAGIAARYGRAHAEGTDFVCETDVDEPSYLMVMCSLVPEANYALGVAHDMQILTEEGSITDLPCAQLENSGMEPIYSDEIGYDDYGASNRSIFGYQPRYMWHKAGANNEVHGLFREGASLQSFIPQRFTIDGNNQYITQISKDFLNVASSDLDNVTAVAGAISQFGVMVDSRIDLFVSEPLGESVMPSLVDPAAEHGSSVYLKRGAIGVND